MTTLTVSEADFQAAFTELARLLGWEVYAIPDSRRATSSGYPDVTCAHRAHGVFWAELKTQRGKPSPAQVHWLALLRHAGQRAYLWRPSDMDQIKRVLEGKE